MLITTPFRLRMGQTGFFLRFAYSFRHFTALILSKSRGRHPVSAVEGPNWLLFAFRLELPPFYIPDPTGSGRKT